MYAPLFCGLLLQGLGGVLIGGGASAAFENGRSGEIARPITLLAMAVIPVGGVIHVWGRRLTAWFYPRLGDSAKQPCVLYLRPFATAGLSVFGSGMRGVIRAFKTTPEEWLLRWLWSLGPVE